MIGRVLGRRRVLDQLLEQRAQVRAGLGQVHRRGAGLGVRVDDREVDLLGVRPKVHEQLVDRVQDLRRARVAAVDLVDRHDHRQVVRHRLLQDVAGLRQRALRRVHQQQHRVDHVQAALDLAAEVGMTGGVDDVEVDAVVLHRGLLGQDRDALLALQVAGVHDALHDDLVDAEGAGLAEHRVHERGLAVVHVGHDRHVADVVASGGGAAAAVAAGMVERGESFMGGGIVAQTRPGRANRLTWWGSAPGVPPGTTLPMFEKV